MTEKDQKNPEAGNNKFLKNLLRKVIGNKRSPEGEVPAVFEEKPKPKTHIEFSISPKKYLVDFSSLSPEDQKAVLTYRKKVMPQEVMVNRNTGELVHVSGYLQLQIQARQRNGESYPADQALIESAGRYVSINFPKQNS